MEESREFSEKKKAAFDAAVMDLNSQADLMHLCLVFLSEDFTELGASGDELIRYLQAVFIKKTEDPEYNPYAEYSKGFVKEADDFMTIASMFEKRGEDRMKTLLRCLKQQGRENDIEQIISSDDTQLLEKLYAEFHLLHGND